MKKVAIHPDIPDSSQAVFGTWALGGGYWGHQDHGDSVKAIHAALRGGVNHFDTAPVYGKGQAETFLGQQLRKIRHDVIIADKCFHMPLKRFEKSFELSLKRLSTDYIDIFYIHWPESGADMRPVMEFLEHLRREGRIRAVGVSNFSVPQMKHVLEAGSIDIAQFGYNLFWRKEESETIPFCREKNIKTAAYSILAQGILTGKFDSVPEGEEYSWRRKQVLFEDQVFPHIKKAVDSLKKIARNSHMTCAEASIFWTKENELIDCSILGCRNRKQTEENLSSFQRDSEPELMEELNKLSDSLLPTLPVADNIFRHRT